MNISEYPQAIANLQRQLLSQMRHVRTLQESLHQLDTDIENAIAFDTNLKNEAQRKARKAELATDEHYQECLRDLAIAQDKRTELDIQLELLRNQFTVAKLERREAIAQMELQTAA